jgi:hypothetical protein
LVILKNLLGISKTIGEIGGLMTKADLPENSKKPLGSFLSGTKPFFILGLRCGLWGIALGKLLYFLRIYFGIDYYTDKPRSGINDSIDILFRALPMIFFLVFFRRIVEKSELESKQKSMLNTVGAILGILSIFFLDFIAHKLIY